VGDQNHGPLSGWLAERRLKKALPSGQRKRSTQSRRPVGKSPPRPSERQRPGDPPPPDSFFTPQIEPAPDYLPGALDEPQQASETVGAERAEAAFSQV